MNTYLIIIFLICLIYFYLYKKENFINAPVIFTKQLNTTPKECKSYNGCSWNNTNNCNKAWKDCNIYQNCINGKCI